MILDQAGAEKLIGQGDMLLLAAASGRAQRIQGSWVDEECVRKVVAHWRRQVARSRTYVEGIAGRRDARRGAGGRGGDDGDDDDLLAEAMELVVRSGLGSTTHAAAQAPGRVRPGRAAHGPARAARAWSARPKGSKARAVLMTVEEFEAMHVEA